MSDDDESEQEFQDDDEPVKKKTAAKKPTKKKKKKDNSDDFIDDDDADDDEESYNEDDDDDKPLSSLKTKKTTATTATKKKASAAPAKATKAKAAAAKPDVAKSKANAKAKVKPDPAKSASAKGKKPEAVTSGGSKKRRPADSESGDDNDDDEDRKPSTKKIKKEGGSEKENTTSNKKLKELDKAERLQYAMQAFLWWDAVEPPAGYQWRTMEHAGVSFPEPYEPHGIKMKYDGKEVTLTAQQEEAATFFAAMDPDGMHLGNPKTAKIFIKNFFEDFKALLGKKHVIKDFNKCDFEPIRRYLNEKKIIKKAITDEERKASKEDRNQVLFKFGFAIVDGHIERVGNFNMEPPGAFRGRGEHPKMGKLKSRVMPEQVSLNLSECAPVPRCPVPGHAWSDVCHDPRGMWLASWKENINQQSKYMQLAAQSSFKGKSDRSKYNKAALLCANIDKIRKSYKKDLKSKDSLTKQLATAVWVIDRLALRVGGEKDTDEAADTVGCCSLRVEHLHFDPNQEGGDNKEIELEFLGKDSMLYKQTIDFGAAMYNDDNGMGEQVYANFKLFCKGKKPNEDVFGSINPTVLNAHLKQFMDGLSAKVFRTYNASKTLQDELRKHESSVLWKNLNVAQKVVEYNNANREVAILCNHQRSVSKAQETQLENIGAKLNTLKRQKKELKIILKRLNSGETKGIPLRKSQQDMQDDVNKALEKAKKMKETAKTNAEKIAATEADEAAKQLKRDFADAKFQKAHLWEKPPTQDQVVKRIEAWTAKIHKMEMDLKHKDDNKEVSLGTSKINYMDPRISVAWCKRNEVPIEKIFSKTLRDKFNWAMAVPPDWEFNADKALDG